MKKLIGILLIAILLTQCSGPSDTPHHRLTWSPAVDSLLQDTVDLSLLADSMRSLVGQAGSDTAALDPMAELAQYLRGPIALQLADEVISQSTNIGYAHGVADGTCRRGIYYLRSGSQPLADSLFRHSLALAEQVPGRRGEMLQAQARMWMGEVKRQRGDMAGAIEQYDSSYTIAERIDDRKRMATCLGVKGVCFIMGGQLDSASHFLERSLAVSRVIHDQEREAFCLYCIGDIARFENKIPEAISAYHAAMGLCEVLNDRSRMSYGYGALADLYRLGSDLPNALLMYDKMRTVGLAMDDKGTVAAANFSLAEVYEDLDEPDKALEHYTLALAQATAIELAQVMGPSYFGIGKMQARQGHTELALQAFQAGLEIASATKNTWLEVSCQHGIGNLYGELGDMAQAEQHFEKAVVVARATDDRGLPTNLQRMGMSRLHRGDPRGAMAYGEEALTAEQRMGPRPTEMGIITDLLYRTYDTLQMPAKALAMYKLHEQWQDSLEGKQDRERALKVDHSTKERDLKAGHEKQQALAAQRTEEQRRQKLNFMIGFALVAIIAALLFWSLRTTRRKNAEILLAQQQVVEAEKQRENEQVRTRIARDIHDEIGSGLTKIALLGSEAKRRLLDSTEELRITLDRIVGHSREVSAALSDIVWTTDPQHDTSEELVSHARNVAQRLLEGSGTFHQLNFQHTDPGHSVAPGTKYHVVMVMKEAIHNALKYAGAERITVNLTAGAQHVILVVADDGKGFDPEAQARAGNGLRNLRARADAIGASLIVESIPGKGTSVRLEGPLL